MAIAVQTSNHAQKAQPRTPGAGRALAGGLLFGAVTLVLLTAVLAAIFRLAVGLSPWPYFVLALAPCLAFGLLMIELSSPRGRD